MFRTFRTPRFFKWIFHRRTWGFSDDNVVYLTFDDGPTPELTPWILELLAAEKVKATFFCVGTNVKKHPELLQKIEAGGHALGNHTMRHEKGTKTSKKDYLASIEEANLVIKSNLFRPPYGRLPISYSKEIAQKHNIFMWTWLSYDYDNRVPVSAIMKQARKIKSGDILVLHDNFKTEQRLKEVLPQLIRLVQEKGYAFEAIDPRIKYV
ncbi:polysaccharide deacetylase family protein [Crocinitomicaceae bacterium]|nr:polysaccharide deacetylase family protein [Crocinitomicaceae bacterium]